MRYVVVDISYIASCCCSFGDATAAAAAAAAAAASSAHRQRYSARTGLVLLTQYQAEGGEEEKQVFELGTRERSSGSTRRSCLVEQ